MKRPFSALSLTVVMIAVLVGAAAPVHAGVVETLTDRCSGDVVVKVPYADHPSLDGGDILLGRSRAFCNQVTAVPPTFSGVCQRNPQQNSAWTTTISYSSIINSDRRFRWFCNTTAERSRCNQGTTRVRFLIGPGRLFRTQCLN